MVAQHSPGNARHERLLQFSRRSEAARRLPPLENGVVDPDRITPYLPERAARRSVRIVVDPIDRLAATADVMIRRTGKPGLWPIADVRALWQRGEPGDREFAERIVELGGAVDNSPLTLPFDDVQAAA